MQSRKLQFLLLFAYLLCLFPGQLRAAALGVQNDMEREIINILIQPKDGKPFFARLDLLPGDRDEIENPDCIASLRVDTGLELWSFPDISLGAVTTLKFTGSDPVRLHAVDHGKAEATYTGTPRQLAPGQYSRPVCELSRLRPAMPMKEVCAFFPKDVAYDDNGALLTGLGFANMTWAARLIPAQPGEATENSLLEHMELRLPLTRDNITNLLAALEKQGYVPWQAEMPGQDIEFAAAEPQKGEAVLADAINKFLRDNNPASHKQHAPAIKCASASIIMAPGDMLPGLNNADEPESDVQIFTIVLRPCTNTLLLDVAAYRGKDG